jgi:hypothetical protein
MISSMTRRTSRELTLLLANGAHMRNVPLESVTSTSHNFFLSSNNTGRE